MAKQSLWRAQMHILILFDEMGAFVACWLVRSNYILVSWGASISLCNAPICISTNVTPGQGDSQLEDPRFEVTLPIMLRML